MILLAHAIIPHHHHNSEICVFNPYSSAEHKTDEHNKNCSTNHKHDKSNDDQTCILKKIVVFRSGAEQDFEVARFIDIYKDYFFTAVLPSGRLNSPKPPRFQDSVRWPVSSFYSFFAPKSFGLRAPPLV